MTFFAEMGSLIGAGLSALGTIVTAVGQAQAARAQAKIAEMNAEIQRRNAAIAAESGREQALYQDRKNRALLGEQLAVMSASGVKIGSSSFARARESLAKVAGEEAFSLAVGADRQSWSYKAQADVYDAQASAYSQAANSALLSGFISGASSIIGSARRYTNTYNASFLRTWRSPTF